MNLEELNQQYLMLKGNLTTMRANLKAAEQEVTQLISDKKIKEGELESAKQAGDQPAQQQCHADLQKINAAIKRKQTEVEGIKGNLKYLKEQIDEKVNAVRAMPEVKKDLDIAIKKNAERQAVKKVKEVRELSNQRRKLDEQKSKIEAIQALSKGEHTSNFMIGMVAADQQLKTLREELKNLEQTAADGTITYSDPARATEIKNKLIPAAEKKMDANKKPLMAAIKKRKLNLTEKDIQDILLDKAELDKNGKVNFNKTFKKQLTDIEKQKMAIDKQIKADYKKFTEFKAINQIADIELNEQQAEPQQTALATTQQPKWWQFATRFRNWMENRRERQAEKEKEKLREAGFDVEDEQEQPAPEQANNEERESSSRSEFTQTLKYEIVRDSMRTVMKEYAKQQEQQSNREENNSDREP